jgi:predicted DNA-binding transcriptional regulator AlpA
MPTKQAPNFKDTWAGRLPAIPGVDFDPVFSTNEAAEYAGFSISHWRAMVAQARGPPPIRLSERKLGWRLSALNAWIAQRSAEQGVRPPTAA